MTGRGWCLLAVLVPVGCTGDAPAVAPDGSDDTAMPPARDCFRDVDRDGYGDPDGAIVCGGAAVADPGDCDDADAAVHPAAAEVCDGVDDDCDGLVDDETAAFDDDGDGYTEQDGDCDDNAAGVYPGAIEHVGGLDDNCDGVAEAAEGWSCATSPSAATSALTAALALLLVSRRRVR